MCLIGCVDMRVQCVNVFVTFVDGAWRGEKLLNLKQIADGAMALCDEKLVLILSRTYCD